MATSASAAFLSLIEALQYGSAEAGRGAQKEFEAIITAVIGGTLLSGGYGSPVGTVFGTLMVAIMRQGLFFTGVDATWYQAVPGCFLVASVLVNQFVNGYTGCREIDRGSLISRRRGDGSADRGVRHQQVFWPRNRRAEHLAQRRRR